MVELGGGRGAWVRLGLSPLTASRLMASATVPCLAPLLRPTRPLPPPPTGLVDATRSQTKLHILPSALLPFPIRDGSKISPPAPEMEGNGACSFTPEGTSTPRPMGAAGPFGQHGNAPPPPVPFKTLHPSNCPSCPISFSPTWSSQSLPSGLLAVRGIKAWTPQAPEPRPFWTGAVAWHTTRGFECSGGVSCSSAGVASNETSGVAIVSLFGCVIEILSAFGSCLWGVFSSRLWRPRFPFLNPAPRPAPPPPPRFIIPSPSPLSSGALTGPHRHPTASRVQPPSGMMGPDNAIFHQY